LLSVAVAVLEVLALASSFAFLAQPARLSAAAIINANSFAYFMDLVFLLKMGVLKRAGGGLSSPMFSID
jgi:hypothetical protein